MSPSPLAGLLAELAATLDGRQLTTALQRLQTRYRDPTADHSAAPALTATEAAAYAVARMPATTAAVADALRRARETGALDPEPQTLLDVGGGTGAALWAAAEALPDLREATVLERDAAMTDVARRLAGAATHAAIRDASWRQADLTAATALPPADIAIAAYSLGELPSAALPAVVARLAAAAPVVIVVEPGTPRGFATVLAARTALLEQGRHLAAPCPHDDTCPMTGTPDWCHVASRLARSPAQRRAKGASAGHEDEKSSYLVATRRPPHRAAARVVRHPQLRTGLVLLDLCTRDRGLTRVTVSRRQGSTYRSARAVRWGDGWEPELSP